MNEAVAAPAETAVVAPPPAAPPAESTTESVTPDTTAPIKTTPREPAPVEPKSIKDSIRAVTDKFHKDEAAKVKATEAPAKPVEAKPGEPATKDAKPVDATAAKPDAAKAADTDPPKWLNDTKAKEKWATVDPDVRAEVHKRMTETEKGIEKYRKDATEYGELAEFKEMAKKANVTLKDALKNYTDLDNALRGNDPASKLAAIETVLRVAKVTPQDYAAFISKLPKPTPEQAGQQNNAVVQKLQQQVAELTNQLQGFTTEVRGQQQSQLEQDLNDWAKDKPLAVQLSGQIAAHVDQGLSLDEAYAKAEEEFREAALAAGFVAPQDAPAIPAEDRTLKLVKSITGAPSAGSHPATQKPSTSIREAVRKAIAAQGG